MGSEWSALAQALDSTLEPAPYTRAVPETERRLARDREDRSRSGVAHAGTFVTGDADVQVIARGDRAGGIHADRVRPPGTRQ
jgi:hypothetical protein